MEFGAHGILGYEFGAASLKLFTGLLTSKDVIVLVNEKTSKP